MSDNTTVQRAAQMARSLRMMANDRRVNTVGYFTPAELHDVADLLAVPTPALTPEQTDVIEAATRQRDAGAQTGFLLACLETHAAVGRLAAATDRNEP